MTRQLKCHRCGSAELVLHETRYEHAEYAGGLFVSGQGRIEAREDPDFTPGEIQPGLTRIACESCGHEWRPRRGFDGIRREEEAAPAVRYCGTCRMAGNDDSRLGRDRAWNVEGAGPDGILADVCENGHVFAIENEEEAGDA